MDVQVIRGNGFILTVVRETIPTEEKREKYNPFDPKRRPVDTRAPLPKITATELRKQEKIAARMAKSDRVLMRKSSKRYNHFLSHRQEELHKLGRRQSIRIP